MKLKDHGAVREKRLAVPLRLPAPPPPLLLLPPVPLLPPLKAGRSPPLPLSLAPGRPDGAPAARTQRLVPPLLLDPTVTVLQPIAVGMFEI